MIQKHILLREDQDRFLRNLPGSMIENIRKAIDDYIQKMRGVSASTSPSQKKGDNNG